MYPNNIINGHRAAQGITIKALADRCGLNYDMTCRAMRNERQMTAAEFLAVCQALGLSIQDFQPEEEF